MDIYVCKFMIGKHFLPKKIQTEKKMVNWTSCQLTTSDLQEILKKQTQRHIFGCNIGCLSIW